MKIKQQKAGIFMAEPTLVVMAAGMGSRFGGLKQITPIDGQGHKILDFSLYDAVQAGFRKAAFIIKREIESDFRQAIGSKLENRISVQYIFQEIGDLPKGFSVPEGRAKPWGTGHAVRACLGRIDGPFAVINADDFYGRSAFQAAYDFLTQGGDGERYRYAMVGYPISNTLTENGSVSRGICETDGQHRLTRITERTRIERRPDGPAFTEDGGESWTSLSETAVASMNFWAFTPSMLEELDRRFAAFLKASLPQNPLKCEYFLPSVVGELIEEGKAEVTVLQSQDQWYGVTYQEDRAAVEAAVRQMKAEGRYPEQLWK